MTTTALSTDELAALDAEHVMPTYGRQPVAFVRGEGAVLFDAEGRRYLDFLAGHRRHVARPRAPGGRRRARRPGAHAAARVEPLPERPAAPPRGRASTRLLGGGGRVFFANSGAEANECAIKLARRHGQRNGGPDRYHIVTAYGSFHGRTLATLAATGQPQKHEPFQPLPTDVPPRRVRRRSPRSPPRSTSGSAPCSSSPSRARAASSPAPRLPHRRAPALRRARGAPDRRRGPDRPRPHRPLVRVPAHPRPATRRRHARQGARQRRPDRRLLGPRRRRHRASRPASTPRPSGASRSPARAALTVLDVMEAEDAPGRAHAPGRASPRRSTGRPGVAAVRGLGLLLAVELEPGLDAAAVMHALPRPRPHPQRGHARPRSASPRRCSSPTTSSTRRVGDPHRRPRDRARRMSRPTDFLEVDDLDPARARRAARARRGVEARPGPHPARARRPGRRHAVREAVGPHARPRPRWRPRRSAAIPSTSAARRSASASARPSRTSPAPSPATARSSAPASPTTPPSSAMAARRRRPRRQPALGPRASRARRSPTC